MGRIVKGGNKQGQPGDDEAHPCPGFAKGQSQPRSEFRPPAQHSQKIFPGDAVGPRVHGGLRQSDAAVNGKQQTSKLLEAVQKGIRQLPCQKPHRNRLHQSQDTLEPLFAEGSIEIEVGGGNIGICGRTVFAGENIQLVETG